MKNISAFSLVFLLFFSTGISAMGGPAPICSVADLQIKISTSLNQLDSAIAQSAQQLADIDLNSDQTRIILFGIYKHNPSVVDTATISPDGILLKIEPAKYRNAEGKDISGQEHFPIVLQTKKPLLSRLFKTVEGFYAASLIYPVFSPDGELKGFVSAVFKPDAMMREFVISGTENISIEVTSIQEDGRIIYDKDILQTGKMTFSDPMYQNFPTLLQLANRITGEAAGSGTYEFIAAGGKPAKKSSEWETVSLHGTEWRIIVSKTIEQ